MIESGQTTRDEVLKIIEGQGTLWVRIAATREDSEWHEYLMEVVSGVAPPRWEQRRWEYEEAVFIATEVAGSKVAGWFRDETAVIAGVAVKLPTIPDGSYVSWNRLASNQTWGYHEPLEWPCTSYQLAPQALAKQTHYGSLIAQYIPSFVTFADAAVSFFGFPLGPSGVHSLSTQGPTFRVQGCSGRIKVVVIGATEMAVTVEGYGLAGMVVELASHVSGPPGKLPGEQLEPPMSPSKQQQTKTFPLSNGLPSGAWVVLKRGSEWIDRKFLASPYASSPSPGVEFVVEPTMQLQALVSAGEGPTVEFKVKVPKDKDARLKVCRTVAAFANGEGGRLLFGVEDDGKIVGLPGDEVTQGCKDAITNFIKDLVAPLPGFSVDAIDDEEDPGHNVIVVTVEQGNAPPYGVGPENPQYYVRRGATTFPAAADQVRDLARSRPPADQPPSGFS